MLRHAIAPTCSFTQVSNNLVRHPRLNSDAKLLLIHVQGLPDAACAKPLGEHAADLGMKPRAYYRAKECLVLNGFLHEWRWQRERGYWTTDQLLSNVPLTRDEANAIRSGGSPERPPSAPYPTVGSGTARKAAGQKPQDEYGGSNTPHPPSPAAKPETRREPETRPEPETEPAPESSEPESFEPESAEPEVLEPEVVAAEDVLLSLRHHNRDLLLGAREARGLAEAAAEWLRRGVSAADLRHALTADLPRGGVRSAVGFLRHRLTVKLPAPPRTRPEPAPAPEPAQGASRPALVACEGPGGDGAEDRPHVFRPVGDETRCGACRQEAARRAHPHLQPPDRPRTPWRDRFAQVQQGLRPG